MKEYYYKDTYYRANEFKNNRFTLVFVHGVSGSSSAWLPYEKIFQNKYNVLTYDIRGHGNSKKFSRHSNYEVKNFAEDLHDLVSYLNIPKFILVSNSFGGLVHLEYLKLHRENVIANVFTSPEIYLDKIFSLKVVRFSLKILTKVVGFLPFNSKPRGRVDYSKHIGSTDWNVKRNIADMKNTGFRAHFYTLKHSFSYEGEYALDKINVPTLIIHGEKDTMVPIKNSIMMFKEIKNAEFISIQNIDHNTVHNAVEKIAELIEFFIDKNRVSFYNTANGSL
ncbi:MAG: alpha/beta hydrolase [Minisyncoccia bacterium]